MAYVGHNHDEQYLLRGKNVLGGTTSATAGQTVAVAHGLGVQPVGAVILTGNAYVASVDATNINVASTGVSQAFTLIAVPKVPHN